MGTELVAPNSVQEVVERIKDLTSQLHQHDADLARINIELGMAFIQLKSQAPGIWIAKLKKVGYSSRVASRLMKAANTLMGSDGTVPQHLLDRLPGDPIKVETLCALSLTDIEALVTEHDCRLLDRTEVVALVREKQGKKSGEDKKTLTPIQSIRQGWSKSIEDIIAKVFKLKEVTDREEVIQFIVESLNGVRESLQTDETDPADSENSKDADDAGDSGDDQIVVVPPRKEDPVAKSAPTKGERPVGRQRNPQPA